MKSTRKLKYNKVFSKELHTLSDRLSRIANALYQRVCKLLKKRYRFQKIDESPIDTNLTEMPKGFSQLKNEEEESFLKLEYLDFFDYLPKEDVDTFIRNLHRFISKNDVPKFTIYRTKEDEERIRLFERFVDGRAFSNLHVVKFSKNKYLKQYAPLVIVSINNMSSSFAFVKFQFRISELFNERINEICKAQFNSYTSVSRRYDTPWYKPWRFGRSLHTSDYAREKALYDLSSELKWNAYLELKRYFKIYFSHDSFFLPSFETYSTNIPLIDNLDYWRKIGLVTHPDFSQKYNTLFGHREQNEDVHGKSLLAISGGDYKENDSYPSTALDDLSSIYGVYLVSDGIRRIAERDIARCNKRISKTIKKSHSSKLLMVRAAIKRNLYYSYRFLSEFSGKAIDLYDVAGFQNVEWDGNSLSKCYFEGLPSAISETKQQIDTIINFLNDATEFVSSRSNMRLQWIMMIITALSLIIALIALIDGGNLQSLWDSVSEYYSRLIN